MIWVSWHLTLWAPARDGIAPPLPCENNTLVRTTGAVPSAIFERGPRGNANAPGVVLRPERECGHTRSVLCYIAQGRGCGSYGVQWGPNRHQAHSCMIIFHLLWRSPVSVPEILPTCAICFAQNPRHKIPSWLTGRGVWGVCAQNLWHTDRTGGLCAQNPWLRTPAGRRDSNQRTVPVKYST